MWLDYVSSEKSKLQLLSRDELNALDSEGYSLLSYALYQKDKTFISYLLKDLRCDPKQHAYAGDYTYVNGVQVKNKSPLWKAAISSSQNVKEKIELLREYGSDLEALDSEGYSLLSYALYHKDKDFVSYLLKDLRFDPKQHAYAGDYYVNGVEVKNKSPLWKAAMMSSQNVKEKIELLHQYGSDLEELDSDEMSALTWSIHTSRSIMPLLPYVDLNKKAYGAPKHLRDSDDTVGSPVQWAIKNDKTGVALILIEAGADISVTTEYGQTLLHMSGDLPDVMKVLLTKGLDKGCADKFGAVPMHYAILFKNSGTIKLLLEAGADTNPVVKTPYINLEIGHIMVASAIFSNFDEEDDGQYSYLIEIAEMIPGAITRDNYQTIFSDIKRYASYILNHLIASAKIEDAPNFPENILEHPEIVSQVKVKKTVFAILTDYLESSKQCTTNKCDGDNLPLEVYAVIKGDTVLLAKLLKHNPEILNSKYQGVALTAIATLFGRLEITKMLLSHSSIDLDMRDEYGDNILSIIVPLKDMAMVENLLERGVNIDSLNSKYNSAADKILHHFGSSNYTEAVRIVSKYSKDPINSLIALGKEYHNYAFDNQKSHVAIATADGFWSTEHLSMARQAMKFNSGLQMLVVGKDQVEENFLKNFNGFVIPGGEDSYPKDQEFTLSDMQEEKVQEIEKLYKKILSVADKYSIPVMGICLGHQYIGLHSGATLNSLKNHFGGGHRGVFIQGTLPYFMALSNQEKHQVLHESYLPHVEFDIDTAHTFSVVRGKAGASTVGAYAETSVVQSISYKNHMIGFQFHPEHYYGSEFSEQAVRSSNLINSFLSLSKQHFKWHTFAAAHSFTYEEAQDALRKQNNALLDLVNNINRDKECLFLESYSKDQLKEIFPLCNITSSEFNWPEPTFDAFKPDVSSTQLELYGESGSSSSNPHGICINFDDLTQNN